MRAARGGGRRDYSRPRGRPASGALYFLTVAMLPGHKESVRHHPLEFGIGVLMHAGLLLALLALTALALAPRAGAGALTLLAPLFLVSLACGLVLFVRRCASPTLRFMSAPDDFIAILASCALLAAGAAAGMQAAWRPAALLYAALLLVYLPLGKLRHAAFFFSARTDYGRRLGWRGVYPPEPSCPQSAVGGADDGGARA